jgi:hypothetical protein
MPDARCTRGPVCKMEKQSAHEHTGQRRRSDIPCAMALRLIRGLPGDRAFLSPSPADRLASPGWAWKTSADLTPASRRQNHTTSPYAAAPFVSALLIAHGSWLNPEPALPSRFTPDAAASTASRPASLTIRIRPSVGQDGGSPKGDLPDGESEILPVGLFCRSRAGFARLLPSERECARPGMRSVVVDYPGFAFNPAASMPAMAQISSLSEVSPLTPTAPSRTPPSWIRTPPGTGISRPCAIVFAALMK